MELATTLKTQTVRAGIREVGINANYWYPVGWGNQLKPGHVTRVMIWHQEVAIYRTLDGQLFALDNYCPHKGVALHLGKVIGENLACRYHGWEFNQAGECVNIPYFPAGQKLPCAKVRSFPVQEKYGLMWIFPGNPALATLIHPPEVPEYGQPGWLDVSVSAKFAAHFSICNENSMDVFHGFLHENLQGWFDPVLIKLKETENSVTADYQVSYKGRMAKLLGLTDQATQVTTRVASVQYRYPHYYSTLQGVSSLYLMRWPVNATESRSFALFFFKLDLPQWLLSALKPLVRSPLRRFMLHRFLAQDIQMMESEQQHYLENPQRRQVEVNPAIIAVQRLIMRQFEQYQQTLQEDSANGHKPVSPSVNAPVAIAADCDQPK